MKLHRIALSTCLILLGCSGCQFFEGNEAESTKAHTPTVSKHEGDGMLHLTPTQLQKIGLTTCRVAYEHLPVELILEGEVKENDYQTTPVLSMVPGRVEDVDVQVGDMVKKGQVLTTVRSDEVAKLESELLEKVMILEADIEQAKVKHGLAKKQYERNKLLYGEGIAARSNLEMSQGEFEEAQVTLKNLQDKKNSVIVSTKERLRLFGIMPKEVDDVLKTRKIDDVFTIVAPRSGTLIERQVDVGQLVDSSNKLFEISDLSTVWMFAQVFEKDIRYVKRQQPAMVIVDSFPEQSFHGVVDNVGNIMDPKTRTLPIRATVDNSQDLLHPNMFGKMVVRTSTKNALVIPIEAVQKVGEAHLAYVQKSPDTFEERKIQVGSVFGGKNEVISGLNPGETVAVKGSLELEGLAVKNSTE